MKHNSRVLNSPASPPRFGPKQVQKTRGWSKPTCTLPNTPSLPWWARRSFRAASSPPTRTSESIGTLVTSQVTTWKRLENYSLRFHSSGMLCVYDKKNNTVEFKYAFYLGFLQELTWRSSRTVSSIIPSTTPPTGSSQAPYREQVYS